MVRNRFNSVEELKASVYAAWVKYLEEKEIIRTIPFDATLHPKATLQDIDTEKVTTFVRLAFLYSYLKPSLELGLIKMTQPNSPNSPTQRYYLTQKGIQLKEILNKK